MLPKQETRYEDMADILVEYKQYVPSRPVRLKESIPGSDASEDASYEVQSWKRIDWICFYQLLKIGREIVFYRGITVLF